MRVKHSKLNLQIKFNFNFRALYTSVSTIGHDTIRYVGIRFTTLQVKIFQKLNEIQQTTRTNVQLYQH